AAAPHGTCCWHSATFNPGLARSARAATRPGLSGGTAISIAFRANVFGSAAAPALTTASMFFVLAEANTSAGAPCSMLAASAELAAKLNFTATPGCAASNCRPSVVNDSVSEAAAKTVTVPDRLPADAAPPEPEPERDPAVVPAARPQPTSTTTATTTAAAASHDRRIEHLREKN